jgi:SAM-dependent methyltransferase
VADTLDDYRRVWNSKPLLRRVYDDIYDRIADLCVEGRSLEIGGGIGQFKKRFSSVVATDIQSAPWLDVVADAQRLPFADQSISNIVMVDVLHHLEFPQLFFREAERVLRPGGRCIAVEPAITWGSSIFYRLLHHEPVHMQADPLREGVPRSDRDPYESNQAIPTILVGREHARLARMIPGLSLAKVEWFSLFVYPLSGGFKSWSLLPDMMGRWVLALEKKLEPALGPSLGFRMLIAWERKAL